MDGDLNHRTARILAELRDALAEPGDIHPALAAMVTAHATQLHEHLTRNEPSATPPLPLEHLSRGHVSSAHLPS